MLHMFGGFRRYVPASSQGTALSHAAAQRVTACRSGQPISALTAQQWVSSGDLLIGKASGAPKVVAGKTRLHD